MYFRKYGLRKTWLDESLKTPVLEDPLTLGKRARALIQYQRQHLYPIH